MQWLSQVMVQRLEAKSELIKCRLADSDNDWDSCFYADLLRNFGFGKNSENFERGTAMVRRRSGVDIWACFW